MEGNFNKVDISVGDIYGNKCNFLPQRLLASSLGKASEYSDKISIFKSLIFILVSNVAINLKQIVCLLDEKRCLYEKVGRAEYGIREIC